MTKKHFIAMAQLVADIRTGDVALATAEPWIVDYIKSASNPDAAISACVTAQAFVTLALRFNPRFDTDRFLRACGLIP